jgi:hypothetical protein
VKKLVMAMAVVAVTLLAWSFPAYDQSSADDGKPTFYRLTPGVYVNGWPRFTVTYPKDWIQVLPLPSEVFRAAAPEDNGPSSFCVSVFANPLPFDKIADLWVRAFKAIAQDAAVVSDKPSQLPDGTPAREVEMRIVINGEPRYVLSLATKKGDMYVAAFVDSSKKVGEDLKGILYSLRYRPGNDELVKVPADVQEFLNKYSRDMVSHDLAKVMTYFSDRFLESGMKKGEVEWAWTQLIGSITSYAIGITEFEVAGDEVYLAGFMSVNGEKWVLRASSIIKENGEWKWYGNQRDPKP